MSNSGNKQTPIGLTIAGSDSGGGAGIQADIKAFSAMQTYCATVITSITAQNTRKVSGVEPVSQNMILEQGKAVFEDFNIGAVKIGMLGSSDAIEAVASLLEHYAPPHVVLDPVMISKSGEKLLPDATLALLKSKLLPLATLVTPNLPEAAALLGRDEPTTDSEHEALIERCARELGVNILLKGGHADFNSECKDVLILPEQRHEFINPRITTRNTHGTGCTLSSAIAANLVKGATLSAAVDTSIRYVHQCISTADHFIIGEGHGPLNHFMWSRP